jgi:hypothetical protein
VLWDKRPCIEAREKIDKRIILNIWKAYEARALTEE